MLQDVMSDLLISLHLNSSGNTNERYLLHIGFRLLTTYLDRMLQLNLTNGNIGISNFTFKCSTDFPNSLVEIAFPVIQKRYLIHGFIKKEENL